MNLTKMTIISTTEGRSGHHGQQKSPECSTWMQSQKRQNDLSSFSSKPFNIMVIQVYAPTSNAEEGTDEWSYEDL